MGAIELALKRRRLWVAGVAAGVFFAFLLIGATQPREREWTFLQGHKPVARDSLEYGWLSNPPSGSGPPTTWRTRDYILEGEYEDVVATAMDEAVRVRGGSEMKGHFYGRVFWGDGWSLAVSDGAMDPKTLEKDPRSHGVHIWAMTHREEDAFGKMRRWLRSLRR